MKLNNLRGKVGARMSRIFDVVFLISLLEALRRKVEFTFHTITGIKMLMNVEYCNTADVGLLTDRVIEQLVKLGALDTKKIRLFDDYLTYLTSLVILMMSSRGFTKIIIF